ncbi:uncharacterized protein SPSK_07131 [Sporothrix schenckii 1099-18]|uniref:DUF676 domain-containing protein n=1 Tax=Sporothrix schenckii 1099-18 TaxID=1397361 RepID=A0A0F2MHD8_SPOSC|nr:uncharacterized protein SPSK_07131 [Sporothrix schenckii 1099-18]KJR88280.1 hypothetical protein SPSK_07131 [Sporothrix schenckii 1099-18]
MPRILLLCFVHGFKGGGNTFRSFPDDLKSTVAGILPDHDRVETVVYPRYETKGELAEASQQFLEWLKARVMDVRKQHLDTPWPPNDRQVGVVLVAHSMGGFVAADALFLALDERRAAEQETGAADNTTALFPPIQGLLALDTPYNGLSRSMFVYGAFSNYSKVQTVFNVMTALSAGPVALGRLAMGRAAKPSSSGGGGGGSAARGAASAGWKVWQLVAVRSGTVGAIAAGGVAAYTHRKAIMAGVEKVRRMDRQSLREGCQSGVDAIGQGLAYINRRNVGESFAWLSAHFTFVGALLKQAELNRRLQRLGGLQGGIGVHDLYVSLGANGYWSGGYFVPERTFCAVPEDKQKEKKEKEKEKEKQKENEKDGTDAEKDKDDNKEAVDEAAKTNQEEKEDTTDNGQTQPDNSETETTAISSMFERWTMSTCEDEVQAHISLFKRDKNPHYDAFTGRAAVLVASWFSNDNPIVDTLGPMLAEEAAEADKDATEEDSIRVTDEGVEIVEGSSKSGLAAAAEAARNEGDDDVAGGSTDDNQNDTEKGLPDESPIDIAATASLMRGGEGEENEAKGSNTASAIVIDDDDDDDDDDLVGPGSTAAAADMPPEDRATYLRHLLSVAQNAGTGLKRVSGWSSQLPAKMPRIDGLSRSSIPSMSSMAMPTMSSMSSMSKSASTFIPGTSIFSRSKKGDGASSASSVSEKEGAKKEDETETASEPVSGNTTDDVTLDATRPDATSARAEDKEMA